MKEFIKRIACYVVGHCYEIEDVNLSGEVYGVCVKCGFKRLFDSLTLN